MLHISPAHGVCVSHLIRYARISSCFDRVGITEWLACPSLI